MNAVRIKKDAGRTFVFEEADYSVPIPKDVPTTMRSNELPFKRWFERHSAAALEGKQPHLFVPHAYWTEQRQVTDPKPNIDSYVKTKVRDQFNAWKKAGGSDKVNLVTIPRTGAEEIAGITEPGVSIWLTKAE